RRRGGLAGRGRCRADRARGRRGRRGGRGGRARESVPGCRADRAARLRVKTTYLKALTAAQAQAMREDPSVFVIGEDVAEGGPYGTTAGLADEFGRERVLNTPISESAICGVAVGAAQSGL